MKLNRSRTLTILTYTLLILGALLSLVPFVWMISTSLKTIGEALGASFFPRELHFENYVEAWDRANFSQYFLNSIKITTISLVGSISISVLAAYGFARIKFPGRDLIFGILLSTMMIPAMVTIIPNFLTVTWLGRIGPIKWINNWPALTVPVMPLSKAPLMVILVLTFIGSWNSLAWPLLVTNTPDWRPISVGMMNFVTEAGQEIHYIMAGAFITIIPILILYFFTQKQFTESIARSGLKG
jgi:ABC-type glycerol-3-phosphate transport system permease component